MTKVSTATVAEAPLAPSPSGVDGDITSRVLFGGSDHPIHTHAHTLGRDGVARLGRMATDCVLYVWSGAVEAGGRRLAAGSSIVIERGSTIEVSGVEDVSELLTFNASRPSAHPRAGGHVHLLPAERVKRAEVGAPGVIGGMHANAACATCEVWLHENTLPPGKEKPGPGAVHSHSENEVIFILAGEMRFGDRVLKPGSAVAIAANAFYSFGVGPTGLKFINFRAGLPSAIRFKGGGTMDEVDLWRDFGPPQYLDPAPAERPSP